MNKICICGRMKETKNILSSIESNTKNKLDFRLIKNAKKHFKIAVLNSKKQKIKHNCTMIINSDLFPAYFHLKNNSIITVGLNSKAFVTLSSVSDNRIMFCIRHTIPTISGKYICEQEFPINTDIQNTDILLTSVTAAIVCGISISDIQNIFISKKHIGKSKEIPV